MATNFQLLLKQLHGKNSGFNKIAVPTSDGFELVPADQVIYLEANDNYTHLFFRNKTGSLPAAPPVSNCHFQLLCC